MATYYFYSTSTYDWYDSNNWWNDSGHTDPAGLVPSGSDDVVIQSSVGATTQTMYANNVTIEVIFWNFNYGLEATGTVTFTSGGGLGYSVGTPGVVSANIAILDGASSPTIEIGSTSTLTVSSYVELNGGTINNGTINGNARFYNYSVNNGLVTGNAETYYPHPAPFYSSTGNTGSISGTITYTNYPSRNLTFYGGSSADWADVNNWSENGNPVSYVALPIDNISSITNTAQIINTIPNFIPTINNLASTADIFLVCPLIVNGTADLNNLTLSGSSYISGTFNFVDQGRTITFNDSSYNDGTINCSGSTPGIASTNTIVFNNNSYNNNTIYAPDGFSNFNFNNSSYNSNTGTITGYPTFNNNSINQGSITGNVTLKDSSSNSGTITGDAILYYPINRNSGSWNTGSITGATTFQNYPNWFYFLANGGMPTLDWNDINHWYVDPPSSYTTPSTETRAAYIPGPLDSVKAYMSISNNTNIDIASVNILNAEYNANIGIPIICNCANFNGSSRYSGSGLKQKTNTSCSITFNDSSYNSGTVTGGGGSSGPIIFNHYSYNGGVVEAHDPGLEFRDYSSNYSTIQKAYADGDGLLTNQLLTITFSDVSHNAMGGSINGTQVVVYFTNYSYNDMGTTIAGSFSTNVDFTDHSYNNGTINGGWNGGLTRVYYPVNIPIGGTINTMIQYIGYVSYFYDAMSNMDWNDTGNWFLDESHTISANSVPTETYPGNNVILLSDVNTSSGGTPTANNLSVYNNVVAIPIVVHSLATFSGSSILYNDGGGGGSGQIIGNVLFKDTAHPQGGIIQGLTTFTLSAAQSTLLDSFGKGVFNGGISWQYEKGVNGSSILGVV